MQTNVLDTITRRAAHQTTRRHSLLTLGGAALAAAVIAQPERASAKKKGKGKGKGNDCQAKEQQRCANDTESCRITVLLNCGNPGGCGEIARCCEACSAGGFITCVRDATA